MEVVSATLNYLDPGSACNRLYVAPGAHMATTKYEPHVVPIVNGRPYRHHFSLDENGFTLAEHRSAVSDFGDAAEVNRVYVPEATGLVGQLTGADHVVSLGWVRRHAAADTRGAQPPAPDVHVDMHPDRAAGRFASVHSAMGKPGRPFRRAILTSLWRAFSPPPQDWPLTICDYRSVGDAEGVPNLMLTVNEIPVPVPETVPDERSKPAASVFTFSPIHRWWYFPDMRVDEVLLFKIHDTDHSIAWRAPHSAFKDPSADARQPRESIEIRTVAFFY